MASMLRSFGKVVFQASGFCSAVGQWKRFVVRFQNLLLSFVVRLGLFVWVWFVRVCGLWCVVRGFGFGSRMWGLRFGVWGMRFAILG